MEQLEPLLGVGERLPVAALRVESPGQDAVGVSLAAAVAELLVQSQGLQQERGRLRGA